MPHPASTKNNKQNYAGADWVDLVVPVLSGSKGSVRVGSEQLGYPFPKS